MSLRRLLLAIAAAAALGGTLAGAPLQAVAQQSTPFRPVAVVNDQAITGYDLQMRMRILSILGFQAASQQALQQAALEALINDRLKLQEGKRLGLSATPEMLEGARADYAERVGVAPDELMALFSNQGVSEGAVEDMLAAEAIWRDVVRTRFSGRIQPGEAAIDAEIELARNAKNVSYRIREIGLPIPEGERGEVEALADRIYQDLSQGGDFGAAVRRYSRSPSAQRGGDVGWVPASNLPPDLATELEGLEPGQVSRPIPVAGGFAIVQLVDTRVESQGETIDPNDPELRENVRRQLVIQQGNRLAEGLLQELRRDALIDIRS